MDFNGIGFFSEWEKCNKLLLLHTGDRFQDGVPPRPKPTWTSVLQKSSGHGGEREKLNKLEIIHLFKGIQIKCDTFLHFSDPSPPL